MNQTYAQATGPSAVTHSLLHHGRIIAQLIQFSEFPCTDADILEITKKRCTNYYLYMKQQNYYLIPPFVV